MSCYERLFFMWELWCSDMTLFWCVKCMCTVGDSFFFLGSRLADSLLVQHTSGNTSTQTPILALKSEKEEVISSSTFSLF